jgi:hypothetical protein
VKQSALKVDPAKVREWQDSSRTPLAQDPAKALARTQLKAKAPPVRKPGEPKPELTMLEALQVPFKAKRPARTQACFKCGKRAAHWHHWVPQEHLRVMMRGLARVMGWEPETVRKNLRRWLQFEANLSPVCLSCHGNTGTSSHAEFTPDEVPERAVVFAREMDDMLEAAGRPREAVVRLSTEYR